MAKFSIVLAVVLGVAVALSNSNAASTKIHQSLSSKSTADIVVTFDGNNKVLRQINTMKTFASRTLKLDTLSSSLQSHAAQAQKNVQALLRKQGVDFKSYWINNQIFIKQANAQLIETLSQIPEITQIREELILQLVKPVKARQSSPFNRIHLNEWGLRNIKAPEAWGKGYKGKGAVVAIIDTGARVSHETLEANYRAENGWFDPYKGTEKPNDQDGHGTHVTGTIVGSFQIGVAPEAQWISCKGCNSRCTEEALVACGQWVVCPADYQGKSASCASAPDVCNNSWGEIKLETLTYYKEVIDAWHEAGIIPIFSNGNSGYKRCGTVDYPARMPNVIAVGSTDSSNAHSIFSSKGPTNDGLIKPDICAPGEDVRSASNTGDRDYFLMDGTSMACPHVSGVVALMKSANPNLTYEQVYEILTTQADRDLQRTSQNCGGIDSTKFPNNSYGFGKVSALKSACAAAALKKSKKKSKKKKSKRIKKEEFFF